MDNTHWKWEEPYLKAFLETNPLNLSRRVADAEKAISMRTTELRASADKELECQAIEDAINGLTILKKEIKPATGMSVFGRLPLSNS